MKDRIRVNGVLYEAIDSKDVPSYRSMLGDLTHTDGKDLRILKDGLNQGPYLNVQVSFNNMKTNKTPLSISLNEVDSPIDGYAVTLRKGGASYRSIHTFAGKVFKDKNEAIKLFDKILDYAFSNFDVNLDNSRIGVRQINKMASAIVSKFRLEDAEDAK